MRVAPILIGGLFAATLAALSVRRKRVTATYYRTTAAVHAHARELATEAFQNVVHAPPSRNELRYLLAVALHETTFGRGWRGPGTNSNNMGALQAASAWTGETFEYGDTHPTEGGGAVAYRARLKAYPSELEGWADLVRVLYLQSPSTRNAAARDDVRGVAAAMRRAGYYEGQGTPAERVANYEQALVNALWEIDHFEGATT